MWCFGSLYWVFDNGHVVAWCSSRWSFHNQLETMGWMLSCYLLCVPRDDLVGTRIRSVSFGRTGKVYQLRNGPWRTNRHGRMYLMVHIRDTTTQVASKRRVPTFDIGRRWKWWIQEHISRNSRLLATFDSNLGWGTADWNCHCRWQQASCGYTIIIIIARFIWIVRWRVECV